MLKSKKLLGVSLLVVTATSLSSCLFSKNKESKYDETGKYKLTCWINEGDMFEGRQKDSVLKEIEEKCGVSLEVTGATHNDNYYTTLNPIINTGSAGDLVFIVPSGCDPYTDWVEQDYFYDYEELIAEKPGEYPYLEKLLNSEQYKNIQYADSNGDGMHTIMPYITSKNGWTIYYRSDWLINIGYYTLDSDGKKVPKVPTNMDEFQDVLMKFTLNDPDGNGKNDTCGLSPANKATWFSPLFHAFGCTTDYDLDENNEPIYQYLQPEYVNFLNWAKDMTNRGYIDKQFVSNSNNLDRDKFYKGTSGVLITNGETHVQWVVKGVENIHGKGSCCVGPAPIGTATVGKEGCGGFSDWGGWWGGFSLSRECENPHAAMKFLDFINSPEGLKLFHFGKENVHYTEENGTFIPNIENRFNEPSETFKVIETASGENEPAGMHQLGNHFQTYYEWQGDGSIKFIPDNTSIPFQYRSYFDETVRLNTLVTSRLTNVTGWPSTTAAMMKDITDELNTYTIAVIPNKDKNTTTDYNAVINKISAKWSQIKKVIKEVAHDCGII